MKRFPLLLIFLVVLGIIGFRKAHQRARPPHPPVRVHSPDGRVHTVYYDRHGHAREFGQDNDIDNDNDNEPDDIENEFADDDQDTRRERAEGLPVPIVPGSRTTEARPEPPRRPQPKPKPRPLPRERRHRVRPFDPVEHTATHHSPETELLTVTGRLSATPERALDDARARLKDLLADRLAPEVPRTWQIPPALLHDGRELRPSSGKGSPQTWTIPFGRADHLIREVTITPHERDYGTVYEAALKVDLSPWRRTQLVDMHHRQEVVTRLLILGGVLAFVLVCLSAISGYIKADEATKGYYTTSLRLASTLAVGIAALVVYRWLS